MSVAPLHCTCDMPILPPELNPCPIHGSLGKAEWERLTAPLPPPDFTLVVIGEPAPAGSKTSDVVYRKGPDGKPQPVKGKDGRIVTRTRDASKKTKPWQATVAADAAEALADDHQLWSCPFAIRFIFFRPRKASHFSKRDPTKLLPSAPRYPATRPDQTKLLRAVEDALTGVLWREDSRVVRGQVAKDWGEPERVEVEVWKLPEKVGDEGEEPALALDLGI